MILLDIPDVTPSANVLNKMHWAARYKLRGQWQWLVKAAILNERIKVKLIPHAKITVERFSSRLLDQDNFIAGTKGLMDSLVREGFIEDDSPKHLTAKYVQHIGKPRTLIRIEAV